VLVAQAAAARPVLVDGLRALGWDVTAVEAYRTVPVVADPAVADEIRAADALTFLAGSAVSSFVRSFPSQGNWPPIVVIGPVTLAAARAAGLTVAAMADPHTLDAMVDTLVTLLDV
jgi:uroporphyrinogen-III synthase